VIAGFVIIYNQYWAVRILD